jgi:hypothetical protein
VKEMKSAYWCVTLLSTCMANAQQIQVSTIWEVDNNAPAQFDANAFSELSPTIYSSAGLQDRGVQVLSFNTLNQNKNNTNNNTTTSTAMSQTDTTMLAVGAICLCIALLLCYCYCCGRCKRRSPPPPVVQFPELRRIRVSITRQRDTHELAQGMRFV